MGASEPFLEVPPSLPPSHCRAGRLQCHKPPLSLPLKRTPESQSEWGNQFERMSRADGEVTFASDLSTIIRLEWKRGRHEPWKCPKDWHVCLYAEQRIKSVSCMIGYLALATIWMFLVSKKPELSMCRIKGKEIAITGGWEGTRRT